MPKLPKMLNSPIIASAHPPTCTGRPHSAITPGKWVARNATWKPQTINPALSIQKLGKRSASAMASRALRRFCPAGALCNAFPLSTEAAGKASSTSTPSTCMALAQPMLALRPMASGAIRNWPNEPPAFTTPVEMPRWVAGTMRVVAAISTDGPAMPAPPAASTPMEKISSAVLVISGVMKVPSATSTTPVTSTRPVPTRSAIAPANGWVNPHQSWPKANARLMLPTPRPVAVFIGLMKRPMVWRVPMVRAKVPAAASSTSQRAGTE